MNLILSHFFLGSFLFLVSFSAWGEDLFEIEHIWLTQDIHVSAEYLCQDGQFIYFKSFEDCAEATDLLTCKSSLKVTPIHFIEKVELPSGDAVTHFYSVQTTYDFLRYELVADSPVKSYDLVESKQLPLPVCVGMKKRGPKKGRRIRQAGKNEIAFMQGLVDSGVSIVNSPHGFFDPKTMLSYEMNVPKPRRPQLRSPLCNAKLDYKDLVTQASGEWTGNGVVKIEALSTWQKQSLDLYINKTVDGENKEKFEFFCVNEVEDV